MIVWTGKLTFPLMTTRTEGIRQSDRVSLRLPVEVAWQDASGAEAKHVAETMLVSRNGGVLRLPEKLALGQQVALRRNRGGNDWKSAWACVVAEIDHEPDGFLYAVSIQNPRADFWDIDFPRPGHSTDALARLLMECSFCQRREVAYLNELELKSFEVRRCVARLCKHCNAPSIWIEARENRSPGAYPKEDEPPAPEQKIQPSRNRTRVKARVLACIRQRGFQEEVAVCEDLSRGGIAFRSRNQYPEGARLEIAVPYTPGSGAIFVPIRIVSSRRMPSAGLFRHGAAYIQPPAA